MAVDDWNGDGKIDSYDDYVEYEGLYGSDFKGGLNHYDNKNDLSPFPRQRAGGMSTLGAIFCTFVGLIEQAMIYSWLDIDVDNVPVAVIIILWIVLSAVTAGIISAIKK